MDFDELPSPPKRTRRKPASKVETPTETSELEVALEIAPEPTTAVVAKARSPRTKKAVVEASQEVAGAPVKRGRRKLVDLFEHVAPTAESLSLPLDANPASPFTRPEGDNAEPAVEVPVFRSDFIVDEPSIEPQAPIARSPRRRVTRSGTVKQVPLAAHDEDADPFSDDAVTAPSTEPTELPIE